MISIIILLLRSNLPLSPLRGDLPLSPISVRYRSRSDQSVVIKGKTTKQRLHSASIPRFTRSTLQNSDHIVQGKYIPILPSSIGLTPIYNYMPISFHKKTDNTR